MSTSPSATAFQRWAQQRQPQWKTLESRERRLHKRLSLDEAESLAEAYRSLGADVSWVREQLGPSASLTRALEGLLLRLHHRLHRPFQPWSERLRQLYVVEVPQSARRFLPQLVVVLCVLFAAAGIGAALVWRFPELASLFASESMIAGVERGHLWMENMFSVVPASLVSAGIAYNNILVALMSFLFGCFYGVGTLYFIGFNGLMLGAMFALVTPYGLAPQLARFIVAHGITELSIIVMAAAAGLGLGQAMARPGVLSRRESLRLATQDASRLFAVLVPALMICACVESYVSPDDSYDGWPRVVLGLSLALLFWASLFVRRSPVARLETA